MTKTPEPLPAARVRRRLDPESLAFESTGELEPLGRIDGETGATVVEYRRGGQPLGAGDPEARS